MKTSFYIVTGKIGVNKINCVLSIHLTMEAAVNFIHGLEDNMPAILTIEHWIRDLDNDLLPSHLDRIVNIQRQPSFFHIDSEDVYRMLTM